MKNKSSLYSFCALTLIFNAENSFACSNPPCSPPPSPQIIIPINEKIIGNQILQQSEVTADTVYQQIAH